jgi:hypothetical protein
MMGQQQEIVAGSALRRLVLVLAVGALMAAVVVATAVPAFAGSPNGATVTKDDPTKLVCSQGTNPGVDTSDNCLHVQSPSGNDLIVTRNPDADPTGRDRADHSNDTTNCAISGTPCDESEFTKTPSGQDTLVAHVLPHQP